jgi:two-component sensor histidine kinase
MNPPSDASPGFLRWVKFAAEFIIIAAIYVALAKFSLALASINPSATPIWPPTGFALAAVLLLGYRVSPAILVAAFITNATTAGSLYTSAAIAIGNTLECVAGGYLINRWSNGLHTFDTPAGVGRFAAICFLPSTAISATIGVASLSLAGYADWTKFESIWLTWWMGDLAGGLLITPVVVLWADTEIRSLQGRAMLRSAAVFAVTVLIGLVTYGPQAKFIPNSDPLAFLAIVPLMWAALRHNQRDTATTAFILACFAVWGAASSSGPFARNNINDSYLLLLAYMISISVPSLALSAHVAVRERNERYIAAVMLELSHRSKNLLTVVQSIARQVSRYSSNYQEFEAGFSARIRALAAAHDLLITRDWQGAGLREIVRSQLAPFGQINDKRLSIEGPDLMLRPKAVEHLSLVLHELATNAIKYGALSSPSGAVRVRWIVESNKDGQPELHFDWKERDGPAVTAPAHQGFGHTVITSLAPGALDGSACLDYAHDGAHFTLVAPMERLVTRDSAIRH